MPAERRVTPCIKDFIKMAGEALNEGLTELYACNVESEYKQKADEYIW